MQSDIEECGVCESTVGAAGVAAWEKLVMVPARDLLERCQCIADSLGARYVWESLSVGGQLHGDYLRLRAACSTWEARAARAGIKEPEFYANTDEGFAAILSKLNRWKYWGSEREGR